MEEFKDEEDEDTEKIFAKLDPRRIITRNLQENSDELTLRESKIWNESTSSSMTVRLNIGTKATSCNILQGGSPVRGGGGRVSKPGKRGTPSKLSFKNKIKRFENVASVGLETGLVGLRQRQDRNLNPNFNLQEVGGGGGTDRYLSRSSLGSSS